MVVEAVQQEGVGAEQLDEGREDLGGVGRPDLARALGLGQDQVPVPAGQQHLGAVGMGHHPAQAGTPPVLAHDRTLDR
jgi:hypothetical protein